MGNRAGLSCTALLVVLLAGCAGIAPVYDIEGNRTKGTAAGMPSSYVVRKGDTLYSIAFRYGLDYRSLAAANGIGPPYTIFIDQKLNLSGSALREAQDNGPGQQPRPSTGTPPDSIKKATPSVAKIPAGADIPAFRWPLQGPIVSRFSLEGTTEASVNKGIDIGGKRGAKVHAAADGIVVYAGGNLRGYGKLIIVKHNDKFLTAYGNNEDLLVKEGEEVSRGRAIATVGASASNVEMLHFEIRLDGKPANPLTYLPAQ